MCTHNEDNLDVFHLFKLEVARKYVDYHMTEFGYKKPNVSFFLGYIEALTEVGLEQNSFDVIM